MTQLLFSFLSIAYIVGIFLWADSPVVEELSSFNPYSLLHIPLYGILTILLIFSEFPFNLFNPRNPINSRNPINYIIPGLIAFIVAVADEIHQAYVPGRNASVIDVLLDLAGIVLVLIVAHHIGRKKVIRLLGKYVIE
jgi:VanZ family protein